MIVRPAHEGLGLGTRARCPPVTVPIADEACGVPVSLVARKREDSRRPGAQRRSASERRNPNRSAPSAIQSYAAVLR